MKNAKNQNPDQNSGRGCSLFEAKAGQENKKP
jgi:hypothetical protein